MKKKLLRNASLVALSAVMMCGTAFGLAGCGGSDSNTISISMFCGVDDRAINEAACNTWAEEYTQELIASGFWEDGHAPIEIRFSSDSNTDNYFDALNNQISSNSQPDVFYVSPKYVRTWASIGRILDLSDYLTSDEDVELVSDIWDDALAFYGYTDAEGYQRGERLEFSNGAWVGQQSGAEVGIAVGLVMRVGASTGGTDVLNLVLHKWFHLPVSVFVYLTDFTILGGQALFSQPEQILYGVVLLVVETFTLNRVMLLGQPQVQVFAISERYEELRKKLLVELQAGVTMVMIETGCAGQRQEGVLCVIPPRKLFAAKELIHAVDPDAFITVTRIQEVRGQGFSMARRDAPLKPEE